MLLAAIGSSRPKRLLTAPLFFLKARHAVAQARAAQGCVSAAVFPKAGWFFSLTVWESPADMKRFASSGAHGRIVAEYTRYAAIDRFHHFQCHEVPDHDAAYRAWVAAA